MPWDEPGATAIVVRTPEADDVTGRWYAAHAKAGREGMLPHVTLLVPFVPAELVEVTVIERVRSVCSSFGAFDYTLTNVRRWPGGIMYLSPEPAQPFVDLTDALVAEFPGYPPYDGIHDEVIPHATVAVSDDEALLARIAADVEPRLPIACRATHGVLVERGHDLRWRPRTAVPFGSLE